MAIGAFFCNIPVTISLILPCASGVAHNASNCFSVSFSFNNEALKSSEEIQSLCVLPLTSSSYSLNALGIQPSPIGYVISICLLIVSIALLGILLHHQITDLVALKRDYIDFSSSSNEERWEEEIVENNLICTENNSISIF